MSQQLWTTLDEVDAYCKAALPGLTITRPFAHQHAVLQAPPRLVWALDSWVDASNRLRPGRVEPSRTVRVLAAGLHCQVWGRDEVETGELVHLIIRAMTFVCTAPGFEIVSIEWPLEEYDRSSLAHRGVLSVVRVRIAVPVLDRAYTFAPVSETEIETDPAL